LPSNLLFAIEGMNLSVLTLLFAEESVKYKFKTEVMICWLYCWHTGRTSRKVCRDGGISSVPGRIVARIDLTRSRRLDAATINSTSTCVRPHILWVRTTLGVFIGFVHTQCAFFIKTLKARIKSHLLFAGIIRSSPFSPR